MGKCGTDELLLSKLYDQELNGTAGNQLTEHVKECPECRQVMREFHESSETVGYELKRLSPGNGFTEGLLDEISKLEKIFP